MFKKILVAIDSLENSSHIFETALFLAKVNNAQLMLLHVLTLYEEGYPKIGIQVSQNASAEGHQETINSYLKQREEFENQTLELLRSRLAQATSVGIATDLRQNFGDPKWNICDLAHTWGADLIVMGRRGHYSLKDTIHGSVSNYVLHNSHCAVLTLQHQN